jgi:hypothetical protein
VKITRANRAKLTPKERTAMWSAQRGLCGCGCGEPLNQRDEGVVGEHVWWFVSLGNSGKPDKLYRKPCARRKTNGPRGDLNVIAHVKRIAEGRTQHDRRNERGPKLRSNQKLQSKGFDKSLSKSFSGKVSPRHG